MPRNITIRSAKVSDTHQLKSALLEIWHDTYDSFLGAERVTNLAAGWHAIEKLQTEARDEDVCSLVALEGDTIVGHVLAYQPKPRTIHVARLYLAHKYHGHGVGKLLLDNAIGSFPVAKKVYLEVYEQNRRAVEFYIRHGFQVVAKTRDQFTDDVLFEYKMEKEILLDDKCCKPTFLYDFS